MPVFPVGSQQTPPTRPMRPISAGLALLAAVSMSLHAQTSAPGSTPTRSPAAGGEIRGRLTAIGSGHPIASGSVAVRRSSETAFAGGTLPKADGSFVVDGLAPGTYTVRVRSLGYAPVTRTGVVISAEKRSVDLGTIELSPVATELEKVNVVAERSEVELAPERNSYSTKSMLSSSGGTVVDALRNIPSVDVDQNNQVSLRGNGNVVVQINGRSTPLRGEQLGNFLAQLPASSVERIEVATSPSAKDDPEGTAGIINLVLTQPVEASLSGGVQGSTGTTGLANLSGNIGRQTDRWTLFSSLGTMRDARPFSGSSERAYLTAQVPAYSNSALDGHMHPFSRNLVARSEWKPTKQDALSFDAMLFQGRMARENDVYFTNLDLERDTLGLFNQFTRASSRNDSQDYTLGYRRNPGPRTTTVTSELRYTRMKLDVGNQRASELLRADASTGTTAAATESSDLHVQFPAWTLTTDVSHPMGGGKLDFGFKGTARTLESASGAYRHDDATDSFLPIAGRLSSLRYNEDIAALYTVGTRPLGKASLQAGLRAERSSTALDLLLSGQAFRDDYVSLFPSAALTYNLTDVRQLRASYSRRITRPDAPQLDPAQFNEDSRTAFRGNPYLKPEYTDAIETGYQESFAWGSLQVNPYLRQSNNAVRQVRTVDTAGVTIATFQNIARTRSLGTDVNANVRYGKLNLSSGVGAFDYRSEGGVLSTHARAWNARANVGYAASPVLDLQLQANYRAPQQVEGGRQLAFLFTTLSARHKLWGESGSVTLRVSDPFNTARFAVVTEDGRVSEQQERRFGQRGVFVSFSRTFGQAIKLRPRQDQDQPAVASPLGAP